MNNERAQKIIKVVLQWAKAQPKIRAVALVGSYARGTARADSDIDLVVLATDPEAFRAETSWLDAIEWTSIGDRPVSWQDEDYGLLWSRRLWFEEHRTQLEIGFAPLSWADVSPLDPGTQRVVADGCRILHDPEGLLSRLCAVVDGSPS